MIFNKKLREEVSKTLQSISDEEFFEWIEMDRKRMALAEMEEDASQTAVKPRKLNGVAQNVVKPRKVSVRRKKETVVG